MFEDAAGDSNQTMNGLCIYKGRLTEESVLFLVICQDYGAHSINCIIFGSNRAYLPVLEVTSGSVRRMEVVRMIFWKNPRFAVTPTRSLW